MSAALCVKEFKLNYLPRRQSYGLRPNILMAAVLAGLLAGCATGPDFKSPGADMTQGVDRFTAQALPANTAVAPGVGGDAQHFVSGQELSAQWWRMFQSPELNQYVQAALANNPSMAAAQAALRQAEENLNAQRGSLQYPSIAAQAGAQREHQNTASTGKPGGATFNLINASVAVSYTVDLFGASQRSIEAATAQKDYQKYQLAATYSTLTANVVTTAIREASLREQLRATEEILAAQQAQLDAIEMQFKAGAIARAALLAQRNQVAQTRAGLPGLQKQLEQTRHLLYVLGGQFPGQGNAPEFTLASLHLPVDLPVSLPSALVRNRPDIRASEELLHQASAQVGVATAAQYPQLTLSAGYGGGASQLGNIFDSGNTAWNVGAGLVAPLFNGGALSARKRAAEAGYQQAYQAYRGTVLTAFQSVADALRALDDDANALKAQADAESVARESLELATRQYKLGAISHLNLLDAQRSYQQARILLVQAQAARFADTAALCQALGGAWWQDQALAAHEAGNPNSAGGSSTQ